MKPLDVSSLLKPSPNFGQNLIKPAIVLFEMVGQIIPCTLHGIICKNVSKHDKRILISYEHENEIIS